MAVGGQELHVEIGERRYPIHIGSQNLNKLGEVLAQTFSASPRKVFIISNPTVAALYLTTAQASIRGAGFEHTEDHVFLMPDGEAYKSLDTFRDIMDCLVQQRLSRDSLIVALGGGVVGDMAGFVAATWQRGVKFVQVPTTLLAQVDSSVGGKTAVNHPGGKNLIGAFHQPSAVLIDIATLNSLPPREFLAGFAEVIKYGVMADAEFFTWLEANLTKILARDADTLMTAVKRSCEIKAAVVAEDETEQGVRALLNLGHTFGHAIESHTQYQSWLHGEAVAAGMLMATKLAEHCGYLSPAEATRIEQLLLASGYSLQPPQDMTPDIWWSLMARDKKVKAGKIRFILPTAIGSAAIFDQISVEQLNAILT